ncbi:MAG: hypothetical protein HHAS10_00870 [Candidatus Altimarinota bacterium]
MSTFTRTPIANSLIEAYGEHRITVHASEIPIGIMNFCSKNCARIVAILEDGFILVESIVTKEVFLRSVKTGTSWKSKTFGLHHPLYGKTQNPPPRNKNAT